MASSAVIYIDFILLIVLSRSTCIRVPSVAFEIVTALTEIQYCYRASVDSVIAVPPTHLHMCLYMCGKHQF